MVSDLKVYGSSSMAFDQEKRIYDLSFIRGGPKEQILHELTLRKINDSIPGVISITAPKDFPIITAKSTAKPLKSYSSTSAAAVCLGSRIYSIGGRCSDVDGSLDELVDGCTSGCRGGGHAAVFCVEVDQDKEWKRCRPMNIGREAPLACAVDGKIYVFGGTRDGPFIGEVYDPVEDEWVTLPRVSEFGGLIPVTPMNVVLDDPNEAGNKHILINIQHDDYLYAYNVRKRFWELSDINFGLHTPFPINRMCPTNAVVVDNFLYFYCNPPGRFYAYDLNLREWHKIPGTDETNRFHHNLGENNPNLFHLGGNTLCFLWSYNSGGDVIIGCAKFKVAGRSITQQGGLGYFRHEVPASGGVRYVCR